MRMFLPPGSVLRELTEEERQQILHSSEFQSFFDCSIRVMERALAEDSNIFFDYSGRDLEDKEGWAGRRGEVGKEESLCVWMWEHMWVFTCMPQTRRLTHAHCVTLGAWELLCSSKYMSSCWCHTFTGLKTPSEGLPPNGGYQSVGWRYKSHKCKAVLVYCSAIIEECCFNQLTSTLTTAATEEHQACGQIEIMSKTGHGSVLNISPLLFSVDMLFVKL